MYKQELIAKWVIFQSTTDSEVFAHYIAHSGKDTIEEAVAYACKKIKMAFSLLVFTADKLIAVRDMYGVRPLSIGKIGNGYLICSENYTFNQYSECKYLRDVAPWEMVVFVRNKLNFCSINYADANEHFCVFEWIYFSNPRTSYNNFFHEDFRVVLGKRIFKENPDLHADFIIPDQMSLLISPERFFGH